MAIERFVFIGLYELSLFSLGTLVVKISYLTDIVDNENMSKLHLTLTLPFPNFNFPHLLVKFWEAVC